MSHLVSVEPMSSLIHVSINGEMNLEGYKHIVPYIDGAIDEFGSARLIFDFVTYEGWNDKASWEDLELRLPHWAKIERVAVIGDKKYEERVPRFCSPFTSATVRFFYPPDAKAADEWIHEGL